MKLLIIVILFYFLANTECRSFMYTARTHKTAYYQCFKQTGFDKVGVVVTYTSDKINADEYQNVFNALSAGLSVEALIPILRGVDVKKQVDLLKANFKVGVISRYWIYPKLE